MKKNKDSTLSTPMGRDQGEGLRKETEKDNQ